MNSYCHRVSWSLETLALQQHAPSPTPATFEPICRTTLRNPVLHLEILSQVFRNPLITESLIAAEDFTQTVVEIIPDLRSSNLRFQMDQCKRILKLPGEYSIWSHLGSSRKAVDRQADADVAAAVTPPASHPKPNMRWRRYNPMSKLRWRKSKATAIPHVHGQKVKSVRPAATRPAAKLNYVNPLYYFRRIKNNLTNSKRQRTPA